MLTPTLRRWLATLLCAFGLAPQAHAHDIPSDVRVQAFIKPQGQQMQLLLRVPLGAMNEVDMPLRGPGYLDLARAEAALRVAAELWFADNLSLFENDKALPRPAVAGTRVSLASDRSFGTWETALAHLRAEPLPVTTELHWKAQYFDLLLTFPITSDQSRFAVQPRWARLGLKVVTTLKFLPPSGAERAFEWHGNLGRVPLDPRWHQAAARFVSDGFLHLWDGTDHLLFIACLVIPFRRLRPLVVIATAFTLAHSLTLAVSALGWAPQGLWFPALVELLIAASILAMALENMLGTSERRRWIAAFVFGLVHGFGFALALAESLQFAGSHLATSLLAFNVGVEFAQLALLLVLLPALNLLRRCLPERGLVIVLSALLAHTAWHWLGERWGLLRQFPLPTMDAAAWAGLMRWLMAALVLALLAWAADRWVRRWMGSKDRPTAH